MGSADETPTERRGVAARYEQVMQPGTTQILRRVFHQMNRAMVMLWRVGLGRLMNVWPQGFGRLLVLEHRGRRTGARYLTPVNYTRAGDDLYCIAAFGARTDWYRNLIAGAGGAAWLPDGRWEIEAMDASGERRRLDLMRKVLIDSGFAAPLFGLHPHRMDDASLAEATAEYCLVRLRPLRRTAAKGGPGDLTWIWIPVGAAMTWFLLRRWAR